MKSLPNILSEGLLTGHAGADMSEDELYELIVMNNVIIEDTFVSASKAIEDFDVYRDPDGWYVVDLTGIKSTKFIKVKYTNKKIFKDQFLKTRFRNASPDIAVTFEYDMDADIDLLNKVIKDCILYRIAPPESGHRGKTLEVYADGPIWIGTSGVPTTIYNNIIIHQKSRRDAILTIVNISNFDEVTKYISVDGKFGGISVAYSDRYLMNALFEFLFRRVQFAGMREYSTPRTIKFEKPLEDFPWLADIVDKICKGDPDIAISISMYSGAYINIGWKKVRRMQITCQDPKKFKVTIG